MSGEGPETARDGFCGDDCRCACGSLLARVVDGVVELKCRRCKRTHRVRLSAPALSARPTRALPLGGAG